MADTAGDTWLEIYGTASNPNVVNASQGIWPAKAVNWTNTKGIVWVSVSFRWALKFWCLQSNCTAHSHSFPTNLHPKIYKSAQQGEKNTNICKASMELWGWLVGISSTHRYCTSKIVVKPKKHLSQKLDQTKKGSVFRLTGSNATASYSWSPGCLGPNLWTMGPRLAQVTSQHPRPGVGSAGSPPWGEWCHKGHRSHPPTAPWTARCPPATSWGTEVTPRNSKESQGTLASEEKDKTSGWLGGFWMGFLGFSYWYDLVCTKCLGFDGTLQGIIQIEHWIESRVNFGVWSGRFLCLFQSFIERSRGSTTSPRAGIVGLSKRLGGIN